MENEKQIAELAVKAANMRLELRRDKMSMTRHDMQRQSCEEIEDQILALAAPPEEPMPWPESPKQPELLQSIIGSKWFVRHYSGAGWNVVGPTCDTPAEAVAAWNAMIARITGADGETVDLMKRASLCFRELVEKPDAPIRVDIHKWLAERKGGADAK